MSICVYYIDKKKNEYIRLREKDVTYYWMQPHSKQKPELFVEDLAKIGIGHSNCRFPDEYETSTFTSLLTHHQRAVGLLKIYDIDNPKIKEEHESVRDFVLSMQYYTAHFDRLRVKKFKNKRKGGC